MAWELVDIHILAWATRVGAERRRVLGELNQQQKTGDLAFVLGEQVQAIHQPVANGC